MGFKTHRYFFVEYASMYMNLYMLILFTIFI